MTERILEWAAKGVSAAKLSEVSVLLSVRLCHHLSSFLSSFSPCYLHHHLFLKPQSQFPPALALVYELYILAAKSA